MKGVLYRIDCWFWSMLFLSLVNAVPVTLDPITNTTVQDVCLFEDEEYFDGQNRPSADPCETCTCQPPDFQCRLKKCDVKVGCKVLHSAGHCCPNYICDCQKDGRTYGNGEKVEEPNPCNVCYCRGGEIKCTGLTCYTRTDCEPHYVPGKCCPKYDHCPVLEMTERLPLLLATTLAPDQNTTNGDETLQSSSSSSSSTVESVTDNQTTINPVGMLEIIEIYPENRTKPENIEKEENANISTTTEFFQNLTTGNDTEGPVIIESYSRVSIESPKFTEKNEEIVITETTTEIIETTTVFEEITTIEPENVTEIETTEYTTTENSTIYENFTTEENISTEKIIEEEEEEVTKKPKGTTLVEILLKWLKSKRNIDKPEKITSTEAPLLNEATEKPINILTALQTELLRIANETKPNDGPDLNRARSLDFEKNQTVELSQQEIADLAAALNETNENNLRYPFTDDSLAPVLSMISDQLQFLKVGEEQPIYIDAPPEEDKVQGRHDGVVIVPTSAPITVHMIKVIDGQRKDNN